MHDPNTRTVPLADLKLCLSIIEREAQIIFYSHSEPHTRGRRKLSDTTPQSVLKEYREMIVACGRLRKYIRARQKGGRG